MHGQSHTLRKRRAERRERERRIGTLAERQHGVVARRQLAALGLGRGAIDARVRIGHLQVLHRGVYAMGHVPLSIRGRWLAAVLACGDRAVLSHRSAACLWGLARPRRGPIDVTNPRGSHGPAGIRLHRSKLTEDEWTVEARVPITSVARTLLDLAEVLDEDGLRRAFEEADRLKLLRMPELERVCVRAGRRKGLPALRRLIDAARDPVMTRSPLEDRFAEFYREHLADLPAPMTNVSILDHEVDAYWPSHRLVVEMDSWEYHHHRAAFERDRKRDAAMQAAGYRVIRLTYGRMEAEPGEVASELRRILTDSSPAGGTAAGVPHSGGLA
jgi:very-short-patch-repair endonuclease/predicted transcriptional regulator of viral defense system